MGHRKGGFLGGQGPRRTATTGGPGTRGIAVQADIPVTPTPTAPQGRALFGGGGQQLPPSGLTPEEFQQQREEQGLPGLPGEAELEDLQAQIEQLEKTEAAEQALAGLDLDLISLPTGAETFVPGAFAETLEAVQADIALKEFLEETEGNLPQRELEALLTTREEKFEDVANIGEFVEQLTGLRDIDRLEQARLDAIKSGDQEEILKTSEDLLRFKQLDKAVDDQIDAATRASRELSRQLTAADRAGTVLDLQVDDLIRSEGILAQQEEAQQAGFQLGIDELARQEESLDLELDLALTKADTDLAELARRSDALGIDLAQQLGAIGFEQAEVDRAQELADREAQGIERQARIAAQAGARGAAAAANIAAQGGFLSSSALQGIAAAEKSRAAAGAGDVLTGLVENQLRQESLTSRETLLTSAEEAAISKVALAQEGFESQEELITAGSQTLIDQNAIADAAFAQKSDVLKEQFDVLGLQITDAQADVAADLARIGIARDELGEVVEDIAFETEQLGTDLQEDLDFLRETFDLGGSIIETSIILGDEARADEQRRQEQSALIGNISTGAALGTAIAPGFGTLAGAAAGAILSSLGII